MQLNRGLKGLMLVLPVLVAACNTTNKGVNNDDQSVRSIGASVPDSSSNLLSPDEQARLQMQELQKNNVVYFAFDKYDITSDFTQMLDVHADFLRSTPSYKIVIEGHTDERGTSEYNIALGERRANVVKMYLQSKGVSADQISIVSYGKEKQAVLGHDEAAYSKNRRAVLVY